MKTKIINPIMYFAIFAVALFSFCFTLSHNTLAEINTTTIAVTGNGTLKAPPDIAYLNAGVRTSGSNVEAASKENIELTQKIIESLKIMGIAEKDIKTQSFFVSPIYDYRASDGQNRITGYEVSNSLNVTIRNIGNVGTIIDACIESGANNINGLSYGIETPSVYYGELFQRAVSDAHKKASAIALTLNRELSAPISITENGAVNAYPVNRNAPGEIAMDQSAAKQMTATYAAPGEIELTAGITIVYSVR